MIKINYLRISVTDRCNLRCVYCNPFGDCDFIAYNDILRFEEIQRIVRLFAECGIKKVRLTGGEPLVRKGIVQLVRQLAMTSGIEEVSLTTNGVLLEQKASELKAAGMHRINVSVDSVERKSYKQITGFDLLSKVMRGIYKALEVGLTPVRINSVIIRGINDSQIPVLAEMSIRLPIAVRFIEYCPTNKNTKSGEVYVPTSEVREVIERRFGQLSPVLVRNTDGPALYFKIRNAAGTIGFISGRSSTFCRDCNRLRLTSDGKIKPCLYSAYFYDLKKLIRGRASDRDLKALLRKILYEKSNHKRFNNPLEQFSMQKIGG